MGENNEMKKKEYIVLDTNILIIDPSVLGINTEKYQLIIPKFVLIELSVQSARNPKFKEILEITNESVARGITKVYEDGLLASSYKDEVALLSGLIKNLEKVEKVKVYFATEDLKHSDDYKKAGISLLRLSELKILLNEEQSIPTEVFNDANKFKLKRTKDLYTGIIMGSISSGIIITFLMNLDKIFETVNIWGTLLILVGGAIIVYWIRCRKRLGYGILECIIGVFMAVNIFYPDFDYSKFTFNSTVLLQILAGVFAIIRGLDNVGKGLEATKWGVKWQRVFPQ